MSFGEWSLANRDTGNLVESSEQLYELIVREEKRVNENGDDYIAIPIRFFNVYQNWQHVPTPVVDEELRYSVPHWTYLCKLKLDGTDSGSD